MERRYWSLGFVVPMNNFQSLLSNAKDIGVVLLRPNYTRKKIIRIRAAMLEASANIDRITEESKRMESRIISLNGENKTLRDQIFRLKEWIRAAHRLDHKPVAQTIKEALSHEKA